MHIQIPVMVTPSIILVHYQTETGVGISETLDCSDVHHFIVILMCTSVKFYHKRDSSFCKHYSSQEAVYSITCNVTCDVVTLQSHSPNVATAEVFFVLIEFSFYECS